MKAQQLTLALVMTLAAAGVQAAEPVTRVVDAAREGNPAAVRTLVKQRADVNVAEQDGTTALHWAARAGDASLVDLLLRSGAKASATNRYGVTPLSIAAINGDAAIIERLLKAGADANAAVTDGESVLMLASRTGKVDAIKTLVAHGANVNAKETRMGETPLMWAAAENNGPAVRILVELGADINARSATVKYPEQKPFDPSNYVGSSVPKGQWTPLMYTARQGAVDAAAALIDLKADVNVQDPEGVTPLLEAILNAHFDFAAMLLEKGANPNIPDSSGMAPLYAAVDMRTPAWERSRPDPKETDTLDCVGMMAALLDHGANINAALTGRLLQRYHAGGSAIYLPGTTPLIRAARYNNLDMVKLLVSRGAAVNLAMNDGTTALMIAAGVKFAITQEGDPAAAGTAEDGYQIVKLLAERGADVNATNAKGETALYGAAFVGRESTITYLAEHGASIDAKTKQGFTIFDGVLNTGVSDDGTGTRVGGKPGEHTVALVRQVMDRAGVPVTFATNLGRVQTLPRQTPAPGANAQPTQTQPQLQK